MATTLPRAMRGSNVAHNSALSSVTSGYSTPTFSVRRYDHLIGEQQTLVRNAQEALKQSLAILQRGSSKEEHESARLQVEALLSRSEELLMKLQVVKAIRKELAFTQQEILGKRKTHDTSQLQQRQQWLEKRLQALLLARYRGRPGARGRRAAVPSVSVNRWEEEEGRRGGRVKREGDAADGAGPQRSGFRELRSKPGRLQLTQQKAQTHHRQRSTVTTISDITTPYTVSVPSSAGNFKGEGESDEEEATESETDDDSDESESRGLSTPIEKATHCSTTPASSKKQEDLDSDEWYSESEANWTITPYSKEVTPSQPCSLDEEETTKQTHRKPISGKNNGQQTSTATTKDDPTGDKLPVQQIPVTESATQKGDSTEASWQVLLESPYGFERPRSVSLFGAESWNNLCLAKFSNYVDAEPKKRQYSANVEPDFMILLEEVAALGQLVQAAARAVVGPGRDFPSVRGLRQSSSTPAGSVRFSRGATVPTSRSETTVEHSSMAPKLPALKGNIGNHITFLDAECMYEPTGVIPKTSRRIYTKAGAERVFPQPVGRWCKLDMARSTSLTSVVQPTHQLTQPRTATRTAKLRSVHSKRFSKEHNNKEDEDAFETTKHQTQRLELLKGRLNSSFCEVRTDAAQALGILSCSDGKTNDALTELLLKDPEPQVRFEALKALIRLGELNDAVLVFVTAVIKHGSVQCQLELLSLLETDKAITSLKQNAGAGCEAQQELYDALLQLMVDDRSDEEVSLSAAAVLSRLGLHQDSCRRHLRNVLCVADPLRQFNALCCLVEHLGATDEVVVETAFNLSECLYNWKHRLCTVSILRDLGTMILKSGSEFILERLLRRLPNEPMLEVRRAIGCLLEELKLRDQAEARLKRRLESSGEIIRAQAIVSLAALKQKASRSLVNVFLDSLELDPSIHVKVQVVRALSTLHPPSTVVLLCLQHKAQGTGMLAQECMKALKRIG